MKPRGVFVPASATSLLLLLLQFKSRSKSTFPSQQQLPQQLCLTINRLTLCQKLPLFLTHLSSNPNINLQLRLVEKQISKRSPPPSSTLLPRLCSFPPASVTIRARCTASSPLIARQGSQSKIPKQGFFSLQSSDTQVAVCKKGFNSPPAFHLRSCYNHSTSVFRPPACNASRQSGKRLFPEAHFGKYDKCSGGRMSELQEFDK